MQWAILWRSKSSGVSSQASCMQSTCCSPLRLSPQTSTSILAGQKCLRPWPLKKTGSHWARDSGGHHSHTSAQYLTRQGVVLRQRGEKPGCPTRLIRGQKTEFYFLFIEICLLEGARRVSQVGLEVESGSEWYHIQQSLPFQAQI